jgi:hypothetical protein
MCTNTCGSVGAGYARLDRDDDTVTRSVANAGHRYLVLEGCGTITKLPALSRV